MKITRRELLKLLPFYLIGFFGFIKSSPNTYAKSSELSLDNNLLEKIKDYNLARVKLLNKNINREINNDLITEHTFWSGRRLYTYAEYYALTKI
tara:strand:+ start:793 stop:1074 length:282 start_codon:yes stop_codon:yes gene_type:complete